MSSPWIVSNETETKTLVEIFRSSEAPQTARDQAFIYLTYRFRKEVLDKCEILCKKFGYGVSTAEMIADVTFESYGRKGASFDERKGNGEDYDESLLLYLLTIAQNEFTNYYRNIQRKLESPYDGTEDIIYNLELISEDNLSKLSMKSRVEYEIVSELPPVKRAIYLTYGVHQREGFKMPRRLLERLRSEFGDIKQKTVNAYLKDVRDSINQAIKACQITEKLKKNGK